MAIRPIPRFTELILIIFPAMLAIAGIALTQLVLGQGFSVNDLLPAILFSGALLVLHFWLVFAGYRGDQMLLPLTGLLAAFGLIMVNRITWSFTQPLVDRELLWMAVGVVVLVLTLVVFRRLDWIRFYKYTWAIIGLGLIGLTFLIGTDPNGSDAKLWIVLGPLQFQPVEAFKVLLVLFMAGYLEEDRELLQRGTVRVGRLRLPPVRVIGPLLIMWGLALAVLVVQKDLGAALLIFGVFLSMLYIASGRLDYILIGLAFFVLGAYVFYHLGQIPLFNRLLLTVTTRVDIWLDPWADPTGSGYQIVQGLAALAFGGVFGTGLGYGYAADIVPAAFTDYPYAVIAEEMGLIGALGVLMVYILLVVRGYRIAIRARTQFQQLLAAGLTTVLALQCLIIIGGVTKLIPLTGITLPFISFGGSSLVTNFLIIGLLMRISVGGAPVGAPLSDQRIV